MTDDLVKRLRHGVIKYPQTDATMNEAADRIEELEAKLAAKVCPLGDECDLTGAYMAGAAELEAQNKRLKSELEKIKMMAARAFYEGMKSTARTALASIRSEGSD